MRILGSFMALPCRYVALPLRASAGSARIVRSGLHNREFRYAGVRTANNFTEIGLNATQYPSTVSLECFFSDLPWKMAPT